MAACPKFLDMQMLGGGSRFDAGWTGEVYGIGIPRGSLVSVQITSCDPQCQRCSFDGPVRGAGSVISQRCLNDTATECTSDSDCSSGPCRFMFPPISTEAIGDQTCGVAYFEPVTGPDTSPVQGVFDFATGDSTWNIFNLEILIAGGHGATNQCDQCIGDPAPNDGMKGGTCTTTNLPCDKNGDSVTGAPAETSYDCAPVGLGLPPISLPANRASTQSVVWTMDATRPKCTASGLSIATQCWCGICSDGTPCFEDSQCSTGVCGVPAIGSAQFNVHNNNCGSAGCNWDPTTQSGTCNGTMTGCIPDTGSITAAGAAAVHYVPGGKYYVSQLAELGCLPSFAGLNPSPLGTMIDASAGLPGPILFQAQFQVNTR
jgi:hypothetical protein